MIQIGVTIHDAGAGIVVTEVRPDGGVVTGIHSLPFDIDPVAAMVDELAELPDAQFVIDGDALGDALWQLRWPESHLVRDVTASRAKGKAGAPQAWLYRERGTERQRLVNALVVAMNQRTIHFAAGLAGMDAMTKALVSYRRQVKEDGLVGPELVTALCLTVLPRLTPIRYTAFLA